MVESQTGNVTILNGQTLTNVCLNKDGSLSGYSCVTKYGQQDLVELPFINDIGQGGETTNLISAFHADAGVHIGSFKSAVVKVTDYPPEAEIVKDEYHGTCVFFAEKHEIDFNSKGKVVADDTKEDYLMIPYIQNPEGEVKPELEYAQGIEELLRVIPQTINGDLQVVESEVACQ